MTMILRSCGSTSCSADCAPPCSPCGTTCLSPREVLPSLLPVQLHHDSHIYTSRLGVVFCFSLTHTVPQKGCSGPRLIFTKSVVPSVRWSGCPAMDPAPLAPSSVGRSSSSSNTRIFLFWLQVCTDDSEQDQYSDCEGVCQVMRQF